MTLLVILLSVALLAVIAAGVTTIVLALSSPIGCAALILLIGARAFQLLNRKRESRKLLTQALDSGSDSGNLPHIATANHPTNEGKTKWLRSVK